MNVRRVAKNTVVFYFRMFAQCRAAMSRIYGHPDDSVTNQRVHFGGFPVRATEDQPL